MVVALLRIVTVGSLRPHIPIGIWAWLNKQPAFPLDGSLLSIGVGVGVLRQVRALRDVEILKSYFLIVWTEMPRFSGLDEMCTSIREDFSGIGMRHHREELIRRLDHILEQSDEERRRFAGFEPSSIFMFLDPRLNPDGEQSLMEYWRQLRRGWLEAAREKTVMARYRKLKKVLLEVDRGATETLTCMSPRLIDLFE